MRAPDTLERYGAESRRSEHPITSRARASAGVYKTSRAIACSRGAWSRRACASSTSSPARGTTTRTSNAEVPFWGALVDQPIAALLEDLEQRGLLDETLVVFATEFGRTPLGENRPAALAVTGPRPPSGRLQRLHGRRRRQGRRHLR